MTTRIGGNMLGGSSSCPDLRHRSSRFLFSFHLIIPILVLLLILSSCYYRQATFRQPGDFVSWTEDIDSDEDGIFDRKDNCPQVANKDQEDLNGDGWGDACADTDGDQIVDSEDVWPLDPDNDFDEDGFGADPYGNCNYVCADCKKLAEICKKIDNCPYRANSDQDDDDKDGIGNVCDTGVGTDPPACNPTYDPCDPQIDDTSAEKDRDKDGIPDSEDNCIGKKNPYDVDTDDDGIPDAQLNTDNDAFGDPCDNDKDNDGILDKDDNCSLVHNMTQDDLDCDGKGDVCDPDRDGDGYTDAYEMSTSGTSYTKADTDEDGTTDGPQVPECSDGLTAGPDPTPLGNKYRIVFMLQKPPGTDVTDSWLPNPSWDQAAQKWNPDSVTVVAKLKSPAGNFVPFTGNVSFTLSPSQWAGQAINGTETSISNDCSFDANDKSNLNTPPVNAAGLNEVTVDVYFFDFGGQATITATTIAPDGLSPDPDWAKLPLDSDNDNLPDKWEQDQSGFNAYNPNTFSDQQLDGGKDIDTSRNNTHTGDGLDNFQEYRGIIKDPPVGNPYHERLDPKSKDLFVRGDNFRNSDIKTYNTPANNPPLTDPEVLPFSVDYASIYPDDPDHLSAFAEARIIVHDLTGMDSFVDTNNPLWEPPNIDILVVTNKTERRQVDNLIDTLEGAQNGLINHPSPNLPRYWTWDLKGASYIGDDEDYAVFRPSQGVKIIATETYYLCLMHYLFNRPYLEDTDNTSDCIRGYNNKLDPLDNVEDYYIEDGKEPPYSKGRIDEDRCILNGNLDGDRLYPNWESVGKDYSVFDADGDGMVENPTVVDSIDLSPDPSGVNPDQGEYTAMQVQLHTVLHEMGHAVGMDEQHTSASDCLMYKHSINWDRAGHFSPAARSQILIHND